MMFFFRQILNNQMFKTKQRKKKQSNRTFISLNNILRFFLSLEINIFTNNVLYFVYKIYLIKEFTQ